MVRNDLLMNDPTLAEIVRRLISTFHPVAIYLFGSVARGEKRPDSDYDLLVVVPQASEPTYRRAQKAERALWGIWRAADIIVLTQDEFERAGRVFCSLSATAIREGKKLYAA